MNKLLGKVFAWMFFGLLVTFGIAFYVAHTENIFTNIFRGGTYFILVMIELLIVILLAARVHKMKPITARIMFLFYSFITGLTFSSIFVEFHLESILLVFLIAAIIFGIFTLIGYFTKVNLLKIGPYLCMGLFAVLICIIVNLFLGNSVFDIIISSISILLFLGFTAYDIQKIKLLKDHYNEDTFAIIGALDLYLDFINLFLNLLRLFGKSND